MVETPETVSHMPWRSRYLMELDEYKSKRDAILRKIRNALESDRRVRAAWLSGSFGRGEDDAWSDLDLHVVITDQDLEGFLEGRPALYRRAGDALLVMREIESDSQPGALFQLVMYPGPIERKSYTRRWRAWESPCPTS
jgi:predicted nucleotidyltransferase